MLQKVVFNLNGRKFELSKETFLKILEHKKLELPEAEITQTKPMEYFFERHPGSFEAILDYLQHGKLHIPQNVCPDIFKRDLEFWGVEPKVMSPCCYRKYLTFFDEETTLKRFRQMDRVKGEDVSAPRESMRSRIWRLLDDPSSSLGAKVYLAVSIVFVLLSLFVLTASTHPFFLRDLDHSEWEEVLGKAKYEQYKSSLPHHGSVSPRRSFLSNRVRRAPGPCHCNCGDSMNQTTTPAVKLSSSSESAKKDIDVDTESMYTENDYLIYIEYVTVVYFTVELLLRVCFAPSKRRFLGSFLNIMDIVALMAMYSTILVIQLIPTEKYKASVSDWIDCLQMVRVFRVFRIVKDVVGFRVLVYSVQSSVREILLLLLYLSIGTVLFASFVYFLERENMRSIPDAAWWVVVTMTTVGYGDMTPISVQGKLVGCLCAICGVFLIAVTVPIFVSNFMLFYSYSRVVTEMNKDLVSTRHTDRQNGRQEEATEEKYGSLKKNKIGTEGVVVVEDYT